MSIENTDYRIEQLDLSSSYDLDLLTKFLKELGFEFDPKKVEDSIILYNLNEDIIGTGSCKDGILKFVVVHPDFRETSAFAQIVTFLIDGILNCKSNRTVFVYTKPEHSIKFQGLGFNEVITVDPYYSFLEYGFRTIKNYLQYLKDNKIKESIENKNIASIVVNCNPFTNGHLYLIEKAASENDIVYLFVVEEDMSSFPFNNRYSLVEKGINHLSNVVLLRGGKYIVSSTTFPSYFLQNKSVEDVSKNQTELDISIFGKYITKELSINKRYVGEEVYCETTNNYNKTMKKLLPNFGVEVIEIKRKALGDENNYISASKVRKAIKEDSLNSIKDFLPKSTLDFLLSDESNEIKNKIKNSDKRH